MVNEGKRGGWGKRVMANFSLRLYIGIPAAFHGNEPDKWFWHSAPRPALESVIVHDGNVNIELRRWRRYEDFSPVYDPACMDEEEVSGVSGGFRGVFSVR